MNPVESLHGSVIHLRRVQRLAGWFAKLLPAGAAVLDVGTGDGLLARAILDRRPDLRLSGVESSPRSVCAVPVAAYDGQHLPFASGAFEVVMFADVLHHVNEPAVLLAEAVRVARSCLVIKDHLRVGVLAGPTLRFMDRVGNRRHSVPVPGNYWSPAQWRAALPAHGLRVDEWHGRLALYPWWLDWWFGRSLHFIARLKRVPAGAPSS